MRPRVQRASGIPCALCFERCESYPQASGDQRRENANTYSVVITRDVPDDALAVERSPQNNREGGAKRYRELKTRKKEPKEG